jgi:hypothetical protein
MPIVLRGETAVKKYTWKTEKEMERKYGGS